VGLNDELEKIRQAEEWLATEPPGSMLYNAGRDHLITIADWSPDRNIRAAAVAAIKRCVENPHTGGCAEFATLNR
jgi:hypothetical protein